MSQSVINFKFQADFVAQSNDFRSRQPLALSSSSFCANTPPFLILVVKLSFEWLYIIDWRFDVLYKGQIYKMMKFQDILWLKRSLQPSAAQEVWLSEAHAPTVGWNFPGQV